MPFKPNPPRGVPPYRPADLPRIAEVLAAWPQIGPANAAVEVGGGFSGARVYRVEAAGGTFCLRCWPEGDAELPSRRLSELHRFLQFLEHEGVREIAVPLKAHGGGTLMCVRGGRWQIEPWKTGTADFHSHPTELRLQNAMRALARVHRAAERYTPTTAGSQWFACGAGPPPAVRERLERLGGLAGRNLRQAVSPAVHLPRESTETLLAAASNVHRAAAPAAAGLARLSAVSVSLHPCLRDVWHDHVLFLGEDVSGIIDASAARTENVASDLSRLLGSLLPDDVARWDAALDAYAAVRPLSLDERRLVRALDAAGVVLSAVHWIDRLTAPGRGEPSPREWQRACTVAARLAQMATRRPG